MVDYAISLVPKRWCDAKNAIHFTLTVIMGGFGAVLALSSDTSAVRPYFSVMTNIASENFWAMAFLFVTSIGLIGLFTSFRVIKFISVLVLASAHGAIGLCFALAPVFVPGTITYIAIAGLGYYLAWRRTVEWF